MLELETSEATPPFSIATAIYSEKTKLDAVNLFIVFGGHRGKVSEALKIPYNTLRHWEKTEWWKDAYAQIKQQEGLVLSAKLHKIVLKSLEQLNERIENGDYYYDAKTGDIKRKPVGARDLHIIITDSIDKKLKLDRPQQQEQDTMNVMDKLAALAANFQKVAEAAQNKKAVQVTDVIFVDAPEKEIE